MRAEVPVPCRVADVAIPAWATASLRKADGSGSGMRYSSKPHQLPVGELQISPSRKAATTATPP